MTKSPRAIPTLFAEKPRAKIVSSGLKYRKRYVREAAARVLEILHHRRTRIASPIGRVSSNIYQNRNFIVANRILCRGAWRNPIPARSRQRSEPSAARRRNLARGSACCIDYLISTAARPPPPAMQILQRRMGVRTKRLFRA